MNFTKDLNQGTSQFLSKLNDRLKDEPNDVLSVFRYWTAYVIIEFLKKEAQFELIVDNKILLPLFSFDPADPRLPVIACRVTKPLPTILLLAIDRAAPNQRPLRLLPGTAVDLLEKKTLFRYHIFIFDSNRTLLLWNTHPFSLDSEQLLHISRLIIHLYHTFDYHEIFQTSTLFQLQHDQCFLMSTGPKDLTLGSKMSLYMNSTLIGWDRFFVQLIRNCSLLTHVPLHVIYPNSLFLHNPDHEAEIKEMLEFPQSKLVTLTSINVITHVKKSIRKKADLKKFLEAEFKSSLDPTFFRTILLPPFGLLLKLFETQHKKDFYTSIVSEQKLVLDVWVPIARVLIHLKQILRPTPQYIILILPALYKIIVDTMLQPLMQFVYPGTTSEINILLPNTNWLAFSLFVPFRLDEFSWVPNLLHNTKWWYLEPQTKAMLQEIIAKNPSYVTDLEPRLSKNLHHLCIWNQKKNRCEYNIYYHSKTKKVTCEVGNSKDKPVF